MRLGVYNQSDAHRANLMSLDVISTCRKGNMTLLCRLLYPSYSQRETLTYYLSLVNTENLNFKITCESLVFVILVTAPKIWARSSNFVHWPGKRRDYQSFCNNS